jgi:hypothetical protein
VEIDVGTDVETDGPIPGPHPTLSFGSAAYTADKRLVSTFEASLEPLPGAVGHPDTMTWWQTQPEAWAACRENLRGPAGAMAAYVAWVKGLPGKPVFVGYPAGFDFLFVYWYLIRSAGESPFSFSALDIKSYAMAVLGTEHPRVRSAYNQARRLAGYLAALAAGPGMPTLTPGVQAKGVPKTLSPAYTARAGDLARLRLPTEDRRGFQLPQFTCPNGDCNAPLRLDPGAGGRDADRLTCNTCGWGYRGRVGTKEGVQNRPPDFFLPVPEPVHQWPHGPGVWRVFGDAPSVPGPRAVVADEIYLY